MKKGDRCRNRGVDRYTDMVTKKGTRRPTDNDSGSNEVTPPVKWQESMDGRLAGTRPLEDRGLT